ncbi:MAG: FHA domain-containing protein [Ruminococcus sp.]|nr:FHA domain-containing protein [Ruminococcus sp.]
MEILMGRHISADLRFTDPSVSRYHAILSLEEGIWEITDLDSTTGTFVNGVRITGTQKLRPNDEIRIGKKAVYLRKEKM